MPTQTLEAFVCKISLRPPNGKYNYINHFTKKEFMETNHNCGKLKFECKLCNSIREINVNTLKLSLRRYGSQHCKNCSSHFGHKVYSQVLQIRGLRVVTFDKQYDILQYRDAMKIRIPIAHKCLDCGEVFYGRPIDLMQGIVHCSCVKEPIKLIPLKKELLNYDKLSRFENKPTILEPCSKAYFRALNIWMNKVHPVSRKTNREICKNIGNIIDKAVKMSFDEAKERELYGELI